MLFRSRANRMQHGGRVLVPGLPQRVQLLVHDLQDHVRGNGAAARGCRRDADGDRLARVVMRGVRRDADAEPLRLDVDGREHPGDVEAATMLPDGDDLEAGEVCVTEQRPEGRGVLDDNVQRSLARDEEEERPAGRERPVGSVIRQMRCASRFSMLISPSVSAATTPLTRLSSSVSLCMRCWMASS